MAFVIQLVILVLAFGSVLVLATDGNAIPGISEGKAGQANNAVVLRPSGK